MKILTKLNEIKCENLEINKYKQNNTLIKYSININWGMNK